MVTPKSSVVFGIPVNFQGIEKNTDLLMFCQ